jgi:hypothetical protein
MLYKEGVNYKKRCLSIMESIKYKLKGHGSFYIREGWLQKGLKKFRLVGPDLFNKKEANEILGVGANMVSAIKYWLISTGLLEYSDDKKILRITSLGERIQQYDPYFEDYFTLWILHYNIVTTKEYCTSWYLFFNHIDAKYFSKQELFELVKDKFEKIFKPTKYSTRSLEDDCECIIKMYLYNRYEEVLPEDNLISPFAKLGLIKLKDRKKGVYEKGTPNFTLLSPLVILYALADYLTGKASIDLEEAVFRSNLIGKIFNIDSFTFYRYLEMLEKQEYVKIVRTAGLHTLYVNLNSKNDVLEEYYTHEAGDKYAYN